MTSTNWTQDLSKGNTQVLAACLAHRACVLGISSLFPAVAMAGESDGTLGRGLATPCDMMAGNQSCPKSAANSPALVVGVNPEGPKVRTVVAETRVRSG